MKALQWWNDRVPEPVTAALIVFAVIGVAVWWVLR